jgi:hypothetical protein
MRKKKRMKLVVPETLAFPIHRGNLAPHSNATTINLLPTLPGDLATSVIGSLKRFHDLPHSSISARSALSQASPFGLHNWRAARCGKETTDIRLSDAGKKRRMSGCQVRERSNGYQAVRYGKEATDVRLWGEGKKQQMLCCEVRERSNRC